MDFLKSLLEFWQDNPVIGTLLAPVVAWLVTVLPLKLIRVFWVLLFAYKAMQDKQIDEKEAVGIFWRMVAVIYGFWPNQSNSAILKYAPPVWHELIINGKDPTFTLEVKLVPEVVPKTTTGGA